LILALPLDVIGSSPTPLLVSPVTSSATLVRFPILPAANKQFGNSALNRAGQISGLLSLYIMEKE
jgi:hypothetical protein